MSEKSAPVTVEVPVCIRVKTAVPVHGGEDILLKLLLFGEDGARETRSYLLPPADFRALSCAERSMARPKSYRKPTAAQHIVAENRMRDQIAHQAFQVNASPPTGETMPFRSAELLIGQDSPQLQRGDEIDAQTFALIEKKAKLYDAVRRGISILSFGDQSKRQLVRKLTQKGYDPAYARAAVDHLERRGYINERRQAEVAAEMMHRQKLYGASRIRAELFRRGYTQEDADAALAALDLGTNAAEDCARVIRQKYRRIDLHDPDQRRKLTAALARYGYSLSQVREAIKILEQKEFSE